VVKKDRSSFVNKTYQMKMLPTFYQTHLQSQLSRSEYLTLTLLLNLLQSIKQVRLERLANAFPFPIQFESRRRKIQKLLSLPQLTIKNIWFPLIQVWLKAEFQPTQVLHIAIDRTNWRRINLLMVSLIYDKRAIPLYWQLLPKLGSTNWQEQTQVISQVLPLLKDYTTVVLGDREFCSVKLGNWLRQEGVYFCLRLKKTEFVQAEAEVWLQFQAMGLAPGVSVYLQGVHVTKQKGFAPFNVACKWQRQYRGWVADEGWFILTNLENLAAAIRRYQRRFDIEQMFRDFKRGGYHLEGTNVSGERLIVLVLLIAIAYTSATMQGKNIKRMGIQKYVGRVQESGRVERRHSSFYIGLYGQTWVDSMQHCAEAVTELMALGLNKRKYYYQGLRAMRLILSAS
jgi:hypothetical protein